MARIRTGVVALALLSLVASCSDATDTTTSTVAVSTTASATATTAAATATTAAATTTTTTSTTTTTTTTTTLPPKPFPKGSLVAFSSDRAGTGALFVVDTADGEVRQVGFGLETMLSPAWSPDGQSLVYVSLSGRSKLVVLDVAGAWEGEAQVEELTDGSLAVDEPTWGRDGAVAFTVTTDQNEQEIWTIRPGGEPELLLTGAAGPAWSPDGTRLAFVELGDRESAIAVLELETGEVARLTDPADRARTPAWSPDGGQIAFTAGTSDYDIWVVDVDGGDPQLVVAESDRDWWPCWIGATEIAYARFDESNLHDIWVADLTTGTTTPLIEAPYDDWFPACQPSDE